MTMRILIAALLGLLVLPAAALGATGKGKDPRATFTVTPATVQTGQQVTFDAAATTCFASGWANSNCTTYQWDDDADNNDPLDSPFPLGTGKVLTRTFSTAGTKYVWLTVTDSAGRKSQTMTPLVVTVAPPPPPPPKKCANGLDDDADGLVDLADPGCVNAADDDESNVVTPPPPPPTGTQANPSITGTPAGWTPTTTRSTDLLVTTAGAVVQDVRLTNGADILVDADNVTIRRVELQGGLVDNEVNGCQTGTLLEDVSLIAPDHAGGNFQEGAIGYGGYTARRVEITGRSEGFRVSGCGPVTVEQSFVKLQPPEPCGDWHGDGLQGYFGDGVTVRNVTIDMSDHTTLNGGECFGTDSFFYDGLAHNGNKGPVVVDGLLVEGQLFPFRLGVAGSVAGLKIVDGSWQYAPVDVACNLVTPFEAKIVTRDANYQTTVVRNQPCI